MPKNVDLAKKILINHKVKQFVDLNTDLGQTRDRQFYERTHYELLNHVTSVSLPCAVHDGDPKDILESIRLARRYNCVLGAHIAYPDPVKNGYEPMELSDEDLEAWLYVQIGAFQALARSERADIELVRPHGALYTAFVNNPKVAYLVAKTLHKMSSWFVLVGPAGPLLDEIQQAVGIRTAPEIYLGKRYDQEGRLQLSRIQEFLPPQGTIDQARQLIHQGLLTTDNGKSIPTRFKTLHISPLLPNCIDAAHKVGQMLIQPVSLPLADIGASGWL